MLLNKETFSFKDEVFTVYELSALQRIELLEYLTSEEKAHQADVIDESESAQSTRLISFNIRAGARVVAMSLWHGTDKAESVEQLHRQVLETWPVAAIGEADSLVKRLSGMLPEVAADESERQSAANLEKEVDAEPLQKP